MHIRTLMRGRQSIDEGHYTNQIYVGCTCKLFTGIAPMGNRQHFQKNDQVGQERVKMYSPNINKHTIMTAYSPCPDSSVKFVININKLPGSVSGII